MTTGRPRRGGKKCPRCGRMRLVKGGKAESGKQRWVCKEYMGSQQVTCYRTTEPDAPYRDQGGRERKADRNPKLRVPLSDARTIVVTWAQNATPVHGGAWKALEAYLSHNGAMLAVIPGRYQNPTSRWTQSQENAETWASEVVPHLHNQRKKLNDNLVLVGDLKIQPTAVSPLTGIEGLTHGESSIVGHPKAQRKCVPTPQSNLPKILCTTGAITVPNHTDSRAGKLGDFHHQLGAVVIEIQGPKVFHLRRISCRPDGAFIDLDKVYYPDGTVEQAPPYEALVLGDAHYRFADPAVVNATFGKGGLCDVINPKRIVWHDLLDAYSVTPHHQHNPIFRVAKQRAGFSNAEQEVRDTVAWMIKLAGGRESYVVASNHDDMLSRWVMREDWKTDPENAQFYLETALHMVESARMEASGAAYNDPFQYWVNRLKGDAPVTCLSRNESLLISGVECGMHGDAGPGGARGSIKNLSRLGVKVMSGHGHSPAEEEGHTRTGTMSYLDLEYMRGPDAWLNAHGAIDAFGKRHLFNIIGGKFRRGA